MILKAAVCYLLLSVMLATSVLADCGCPPPNPPVQINYDGKPITLQDSIFTKACKAKKTKTTCENSVSVSVSCPQQTYLRYPTTDSQPAGPVLPGQAPQPTPTPRFYNQLVFMKTPCQWQLSSIATESPPTNPSPSPSPSSTPQSPGTVIPPTQEKWKNCPNGSGDPYGCPARVPERDSCSNYYSVDFSGRIPTLVPCKN
jgi:hypothetical protein